MIADGGTLAPTGAGNDVNQFFCATCTAHPYHHQMVMGPDKLVLRTSLLEEARGWKPAVAIYGKDKPDWLPEVTKTMDTT